jgi:hypothetical protein
MYSGRHVVDIDFLPLGQKSDREEGEFWGFIFKIWIFKFSQQKQPIVKIIERTISKK